MFGNAVQPVFLKKINFFLFSDRFDVLISKIKKYHFDAILSKKKNTLNRNRNYGWAKKPKNPNSEKKTRLNRLKFWKNWPVQFGFICLKPKKPNRTQTEENRAKPKKPIQTEKTDPNRFEPVFVLKTNRNWSVWTGFSSVLVFFKKLI